MGFRKSIKLASSAIAFAVFVLLFAGTAHAQQDITPPSLVAVSFEPAQVDTSAGPQTITVTVHATDDLSGLAYMQISFESLEARQHKELFEYASRALKSGTLQDGYFVITATLPQYSAYGEWEMTSVSLTDSLSNHGGAWKGLTGDDTNWLPQYDGIRFRNGPMPVGGKRLFLPAVSSF